MSLHTLTHTHADGTRSTYRLQPGSAIPLALASLKPARKPRMLADRRSYPKYKPGMSTAEYVALYEGPNNHGRAIGCAGYWQTLNTEPATLYSGIDTVEVIDDAGPADVAPGPVAPAVAEPMRAPEPIPAVDPLAPWQAAAARADVPAAATEGEAAAMADACVARFGARDPLACVHLPAFAAWHSATLSGMRETAADHARAVVRAVHIRTADLAREVDRDALAEMGLRHPRGRPAPAALLALRARVAREALARRAAARVGAPAEPQAAGAGPLPPAGSGDAHPLGCGGDVATPLIWRGRRIARDAAAAALVSLRAALADAEREADTARRGKHRGDAATVRAMAERIDGRRAMVAELVALLDAAPPSPPVSGDARDNSAESARRLGVLHYNDGAAMMPDHDLQRLFPRHADQLAYCAGFEAAELAAEAAADAAACEADALERVYGPGPHLNMLPAGPGKARAVCVCCGARSAPVALDHCGEPDLWTLPRGWSQAAFPPRHRHRDGSTGSWYTCPACNRRLSRGERLQLRRTLPLPGSGDGRAHPVVGSGDGRGDGVRAV